MIRSVAPARLNKGLAKNLFEAFDSDGIGSVVVVFYALAFILKWVSLLKFTMLFLMIVAKFPLTTHFFVAFQLGCRTPGLFDLFRNSGVTLVELILLRC